MFSLVLWIVKVFSCDEVIRFPNELASVAMETEKETSSVKKAYLVENCYIKNMNLLQANKEL